MFQHFTGLRVLRLQHNDIHDIGTGAFYLRRPDLDAANLIYRNDKQIKELMNTPSKYLPIHAVHLSASASADDARIIEAAEMAVKSEARTEAQPRPEDAMHNLPAGLLLLDISGNQRLRILEPAWMFGLSFLTEL
ncbi:unnamed protein product [Protopolystoma xenopodis]|uniref:Uncharacterized protein n=1 Tax=Protopolystoma xenopodis TaxID=117903 RepID=A0A448WC76_9PLAT|nr:unnamed protein product [Protopolystoma xenopodis]